MTTQCSFIGNKQMPQALPFIMAAATVGSMVQQRKSAKESQKQYRESQKRAEVENVYKTRQAIRAARLAQSAMVNQAALTGGIGSSGLAGGVSSVQSQLGGNLNYMATIAEHNTAITNSQISGAKAESNGAMWGQVGKLSSTIFAPYIGATPSSSLPYAGGWTGEH
jgi:hypothetical protein